MWPQYIFLFFVVLGLGINLAKHGEPRGNYNIFWNMFDASITLALLYFGGFFKGIF